MKRYTEPVLITLGVVALLVVLNYISRWELREVQSGKSELWCHLHTGYKKIDPDNVIGLHSNGKWLFNNGSARSCEVVKLDD